MSEMAKDEVTFPTEEELATLPHWAKVAFAARCARRVQPLFKHSWPDAPQEHVDAVDKAICLAERCALTATKIPLSSTAAVKADQVSADAGYGATGFGASALAAAATSAAYAPSSVSAAAVAASAASYAARATYFDSAYATDAASYASVAANTCVAMRRDFELLAIAAKREGWTDETPVSPEFFGPLWPDGAPKDWPESELKQDHDQSRLRLQFSIPPEVDREEADRIIQEIMLAANKLHLAHGGSGLTLADKVYVYEPALVPAGGGE